MAESETVKNRRSGILDIIVGANSYRVKWEEGNLNLNYQGQSVANYKDRGEFNETPGGQPQLAYDEDQPTTFTFSAYLRDLSDNSYVTLPEFIFRVGQVLASWGTTMVGNGTEAVATATFRWTIKGIAHGDTSDHVAELHYCHITSATLVEGSPNMISMNLTSFERTPTIT